MDPRFPPGQPPYSLRGLKLDCSCCGGSPEAAETATKLRIQATETDFDRIQGRSSLRTLAVGHRFTPYEMAHPEFPQDDFERQLFRKASDLEKEGVPQGEVQEWFDKERAARRRRDTTVEEKPRPKPIPPPPGTVRIDGKRRKCLVDEYKKLLSVCDGDSHHIVPDMVYRLGARPKGAEMSSTADRIPNAPTLNEGMAVCLSEAQHGSGVDGIHADLRQSLNGLGAAHTPSGTAPFGSIVIASEKSIDNIKDLPPECKALVKSKLSEQISQKGLNPRQPGRTLEKPLPSGDARSVLQRGYY